MATTDETRERRQLTIAFCDLVEATALSNALDPEDYGDLVQTFRSACEKVVAELNGHVAQYLGDGILLYFGYPTAQEDAPVRALRVALRIVEAVSAMNGVCRLPPGLSAQVRVGVHTGVVVTPQEGIGGRGSELVLGSTPNVAARLQAIAAPNSVVISQDTYRLASGFFDFEPLGERALKGVPEPMPVYRVLGTSGVSSRFEVSVSAGLSPFMGRNELLERIDQSWASVLSGRGQAMTVRGEAGVGKSRLVHELRSRLEPKHQWIQATCSEQARSRAFYSAGLALKSLAGMTDNDDEASRLLKLERTLELHGQKAPEQLQLCAALVDLKLPPDRDVPLGLRPAEIRSQTIAILLKLLGHASRKAPLVICFEDLHWVDPSSEELILALVQSAERHALLCLCTFRPAYAPEWVNLMSGIELAPLTIGDTKHLATHLLKERASSRVIERIAVQSDGIPLFAEELARAALEADDAEGPASSQVPATLQDSLMARLDRLPEGKRVAQLASICGREVPEALLKSLGSLDGHVTTMGLTQLLDAGILHRAGPSSFSFRHALVHDAAYGSMLKRTRRQYHSLVADALLRDFPTTELSRPEIVAHHFFESGRLELAAEYWIRAAQGAADAAASREAETQLSHAHDALQQIADQDQRLEFELKVQMVKGQLAIASQGYASPAVESAYTRALELCRSLGHAPSAGTVTKLLASRVLCADDLVKARPVPDPLFWVLWGFGAFHQARAEHRRALEIGERLLQMAAGRPELLVEGHFGAGSSLYYLGEFEAAAAHLEQGWQASKLVSMATAGPTGHRADFLCLGYLSLCHWHLGDIDRAQTENADAVQLAQDAQQLYVAASGHAMRASLMHLMRDAAGALAAAEAALELADKYGFGFVVTWVKPILGWGMVQSAGDDAGLQMIREVLASYGPNSTRVFQTYVLGLAAESQLELGRVADARDSVDEALELAEETGERFWEPELFRLRGAIELATPSGSGVLAQATLRRALLQAREQRAKSTERRVVQQLRELAAAGKAESGMLAELTTLDESDKVARALAM